MEAKLKQELVDAWEALRYNPEDMVGRISAWLSEIPVDEEKIKCLPHPDRDDPSDIDTLAKQEKEAAQYK